MAVKEIPSLDALNEWLILDHNTGRLYWRKRQGGGLRKPNGEAFANVDKKGYLRGRLLGRLYMAHRVVFKMAYGFDPDQIDHINGVKSDNRPENLRSCTNEQNARNYVRKGSFSSQYRGVSYVGRDKVWRAAIGVNMRKIALGSYNSEIKAAKAYDKAAKIYHGAYARLNFPTETEGVEK